MDVICGRSGQDGSQAITNLAAHFPAGTSVKDLDHYEQFIGQETFARFDYGAQNPEHYGVKLAPKYDMEGFKLTTALFVGSKDTLAGPADVAQLREKLNNSRVVFSKAPGQGVGLERRHVHPFPLIFFDFLERGGHF